MSSAPSKFPRVLGATASRGFVLMVAIVTVAVVVSLILANVYSSDMSGRATAVAPPATNASPSLAVPIVLTTPNLVENGGFEASVSLWGARAPNTFVRSTRLAKTGKASGLATRDVRTADTDAANFRMALGAGRTYALSCWLYVPSSYSGADVQLNPEWVGATSVTAAVADEALRNQWQHVRGAFRLGPTSTGYLVLRLPGARTGDFVYVDDVKVQAMS